MCKPCGEQACSRRRAVCRYTGRLTYRHREQARSHRFLWCSQDPIPLHIFLPTVYGRLRHPE
nr:hypothetical protein C1892_20735 [Pseudomonas sp. MPBD7-1]